MAFKADTIYNENEGAKLIRAEILKIVDEQVFSAWLEPVTDELWYTMETVEIPNGVFTSMLGTVWMDEIGEFDEFPIGNKEQWYEKGYKLSRFGKKVAISKSLRKWIEASTKSPKLDWTVKMELRKLSNDINQLINSVKITKAERATELFTKGFSKTAAYWPGSGTPDGVALFSASHVIKSTWALQSNLISWALTQTTLENAITALRNMRDGMGRKMKRAKVYQLFVSSENEKNARRILNDGSNFAASVLDTATTNDVTANVFQWDGFRIELVVLETLNQPKWDGTTVGSATMWFLMNREAARQLEAFKYIVLYNEEMDMYEDKPTKVVYVDMDLSFNVDAYNYEVVCGSTWL